MSTCWHGKEGFCEICYLINGERHLRAVEKNNGKFKPDRHKQTGTGSKVTKRPE